MKTFVLIILVFALGLRLGYKWGTAVTFEWLRRNYPRYFTLKKEEFFSKGDIR